MKLFSRGGARVTIDGRDFAGRNIIINGDKVMVDGVEQSGSLVGQISVTVHGDVDELSTGSGPVQITGAVGSVKTTNGNVTCADVRGAVTTVNGDVLAHAIGGNVSSVNGDINRR